MRVNAFKSIHLAFLLFLAPFFGCGSSQPPMADVEGTITAGGKALEAQGLAIIFMPPDGQPVVFGVESSGAFKGKVPVGESKLALRVFSQSGGDEERKFDNKSKRDRGTPAPKAVGKTISPVPQKFLDPLTSGKTFMVESGKVNTLVWEVR